MVTIPLSIAILTIAIGSEVGHKIWEWLVHDVEEGVKHPGDRTDRAEFNQAVSKGAMFINTALLVMFCIVCQSSKDL
jgi:hypothetical protein